MLQMPPKSNHQDPSSKLLYFVIIQAYSLWTSMYAMALAVYMCQRAFLTSWFTVVHR